MMVNPSIENQCTSFPESQFKQYLLDDETYPLDYEIINFEVQEEISQENEPTTYVYIVASGVVMERQDNRVINFLGENEFIGLGEIIDRVASTTAFIALTQVQLYKINAQDISVKLGINCYGMGILADVLNHRILTLTERLTTSKTNHENVLGTIVKLAAMHGEQDSNQIQVKRYFTEKMIASYLQISYTSVLAAYEKYREEGIFHDDGDNIIIHMTNIAPKSTEEMVFTKRSQK
ncbi:Crp/Fnr family transcriptional regulator [Listeria weihenstephanensis]|uniref:Crp/Fnr family transcriptional regulator n=1 Tax=Listeria weihenstephanensis TaxID=1006155 RepID=A0A841Z632_9LIST|nr:Crp/Fnr family transcriptional regulator [Listeria weihenstephanensis]MBC1499786.1 Crp/Fnr family transcriptional regulator [Listeria weihenstephanensis]